MKDCKHSTTATLEEVKEGDLNEGLLEVITKVPILKHDCPYQDAKSNLGPCPHRPCPKHHPEGEVVEEGKNGSGDPIKEQFKALQKEVRNLRKEVKDQKKQNESIIKLVTEMSAKLDANASVKK